MTSGALLAHEDVEKALVNWQVFSNTRSEILDIIEAEVVILFEDPPFQPSTTGSCPGSSPAPHGRPRGRDRDFCARSLDPLVAITSTSSPGNSASVMPVHVHGMLLGIPEQTDHGAEQDRRKPAHRPRQAMQVKEENVASGDMFADYIEWRAQHPSR